MAGPQPLWKKMESAYRASSGTFINHLDEEELPGPDREEFAAMLRVVTDWLVPFDLEPAKPDYAEDGMGWPEWYEWLERKRLRSILLDEVLKAEEHDQPG